MSKHIIITGTSRGIGFELVKIFASQGHHIYALSRNNKPIAELHLDDVQSISCDLGDEDEVTQTVRKIKSKTNQIDILIHNAGLFLNQSFKDSNLQDVKAVYNTNIFGP